MKRIVLATAALCALLGALAANADNQGHWPSKGSQMMLPATDPCAATSIAGELTVQTVTCEGTSDPNSPLSEGFFVDKQFPDAGMVRGECDDGTNDGTSCEDDATCTGGGVCEPLFTFSIWTRAVDTAGIASVDLWAQLTPEDSDYDANEGIAAGAAFTGSATVAGAAGDFFVITVSDVKAYNDGTSAECTIATCKNKQFKVLIRNSGTLTFEAVAVDFAWDAPQ